MIYIFNKKLPQLQRLVLLLIVYTVVLSGSLWISFQLRFEFKLRDDQFKTYAQTAEWMTPLSLLILWLMGQFRSLLSYFSVPDLIRISKSQIAVCIVALFVWYATQGEQAPQRSILLINFLLGTTGLVAFRLILRLTRERYHEDNPRAVRQGIKNRRVAVIGATDTGAHMVKEMIHRPDMRMEPIAIFGEDPKHWGRQIHGVPIIGSHMLLPSAATDLNISEVVIAETKMSSTELQQMVRKFSAAGLTCKVPAPSGLLVSSSGELRPQIRPVEIEDLLGREPIDLRTDQIRNLIENRCIVISGAGGSIGSELCRNVLAYKPLKIILVEQCEGLLFAIEQELLSAKSEAAIVSCVADVLDEHRIREIFRQHRPDIVFHAAAHKHVPMMEHQPAEAFQNNVVGTMRLAEVASDAGCDRFVLISSDKAINPTSVMGATKRLAEIYLQSLQARKHTRTKFIAVRFGNVLGSSGSVIPTFKKQIAEGGPVTVTHPEITRYFMVTKEACGLVLQSATQGEGGEIFVLDMGTPIKIMDLARQMIELSGLRPDLDIKIKLTGLRPGEKLFEELTHSTEDNTPTHHPKIMRFIGRPAGMDSLSLHLQHLHGQSRSLTETEMKMELKKLVPEYEPYLIEINLGSKIARKESLGPAREILR